MLMLSVVCEPKKMAHVLHHWFPHEMMSEKPMQKFHKLRHDITAPIDLCHAPHWSCCKGNLLKPIRSTNQIWIVTLVF